MKRWLLLENNPALLRADWLPTADVCPDLAPQRAEHERLLGIARQEADALGVLRARHEAEDAARGETLKAAFLTGGEPGEDGRETEEQRDTDLADAELRVEAAYDALVVFLTEAVAEVQHRAPEWYEVLEGRRTNAQAKLAEARRLLAEAESQAGEIERFAFWLDRESGKSALGHIPFAEIGTPSSAHVATKNGPTAKEVVEHAA